MKRKQITLIGLGSMGSALAKLLLKNNYPLTVWNRTPRKAEGMTSLGASFVSDIRAAIRASEIIIISVSNYNSSKEILRKREIEELLEGKILIQLSTGTPSEAIEEGHWADARGIRLLDGAIMVTPQQMGTPEATLLVSGSLDAYSQSEGILKALAPHTMFMGEKVNAASAYDLALLSYFFSALIGFTHAAHISNVEELDVKKLGNLIQSWSPAVGGIMKECSDRIAANDFTEPQGSMQTCYLSMELISKHAREAGISEVFPAFATALFKKGVDAGIKEEDGSAIYKVLAV